MIIRVMICGYYNTCMSIIILCASSLVVLPLHKQEGSDTAPLLHLELFFSQEILGNMNMQILRPQHDRDMQVQTTIVLIWHIGIECAACSPCAVVSSVSLQSVKHV